MAEEPKKISFGFTKINKKSVLSLPKKEEKEIQFIACLEENSIKLLNGEEKDKELPIIPLRNGNILRDNMIEALKARKEKNKLVSDNIGNVETENSKDDEETKPLTLDELAAKEILEDLKKVNEIEEIQETLSIPQVESVKISEKESTLDDYESMPVNQFGLAVLRGMGWKPEKGIGKNAKIVEPVNPVLRPKGMGLGADKVVQNVKTESKEELVMKKGACIKVVSGHNKGSYGKVEGFNDLPGRIIVRLALQNDVISISENLVVLVTSSEYNKNSKILNLKEYNDYLDKKTLPGTAELNEKTAVRDIKKENSSSEDDRKSKRENKNQDSYRNRGRKKSDDILESRNRKYKYSQRRHSSSESDYERRTKHKKDHYQAKRTMKYDKVSVSSETSDSDSSNDRRKSKSKKHHKHSSKHRSRSRSKTHKKKKKRNRRSRS